MNPGSDNWAGKTVMVTGGAGFLGSHLGEELRSRSDDMDVFVPRSDEYDLRERANIRRAFVESEADIVIHLAATVGGIGANRDNPGRYFYDNSIMSIELLELARQFEVEKFTILGTICAYPKHTPVPFSEEDLFDGYPEETNAPYGIAKKALLTQSWAYRKQYGFDSILPYAGQPLRPSGRLRPPDVPRDPRERGAEAITAWGSGEPTREFLYVKDAAEGILDATERYDGRDPVNLGSGVEISIRELVETIADLTGFQGMIQWDTSKPDGQPRRRLEVSRARERFGWEATTSFEEGLKRTIDWYRPTETR